MNRRHETAYNGTFVMSAELRIGVGVKECIRKTEVEMRKLSGTVPYTSPSCLGTISFHLGDAGNSGSGSGTHVQWCAWLVQEQHGISTYYGNVKSTIR